jgi:2-aminoadipate transaminase
MAYKYAEVSNRIVASEIREILKWSRKPGVISFGGGLPDSSLFPVKEIADITNDVLEKKGYLALQYGPTQGEKEMIDALIGLMSGYDEKAEEENICVTSSSQQGLDLLSLLFIDCGSPIIMELPSYLGAIQAFRRCGAEMIGIPMDNEGIDLDALTKKLEELDKKGTPPRFIYTIPDFQNPSGITMTLEKRKKLIEIAKGRNIPIIEDSPYRELSFTGEILPSLWTLSGGENVILLKTFSKALFPGMRMGWTVGEKSVIEKIVMLKQSVDLCTPPFNQLILAEYIRRGKMKESIKKAIECYRPKAKAMLEEMEKNMPKEVTWSKPTGGMFLWLTLPEGIDAKDIFMNAIENNVAYVTGRPFHCDNSGGNTIRLNYSFPSIEQIRDGIKRLSKTISDIL